jgi:transposase InsO family protein
MMSDNLPAYLSCRFAKACRALGLNQIRTRPYTPRTNGKAERFIHALFRAWTYGMLFQNSEERNQLSGDSENCPATCRSITVSGTTQPSAADHLSRVSTSCSADQRGET